MNVFKQRKRQKVHFSYSSTCGPVPTYKLKQSTIGKQRHTRLIIRCDLALLKYKCIVTATKSYFKISWGVSSFFPFNLQHNNEGSFTLLPRHEEKETQERLFKSANHWHYKEVRVHLKTAKKWSVLEEQGLCKAERDTRCLLPCREAPLLPWQKWRHQPHAASFQSLTFCGSVHALVYCRVSILMVKTARACEVWCSPGPGSREPLEQKMGSPQHHCVLPGSCDPKEEAGSAALDHEGSGALSRSAPVHSAQVISVWRGGIYPPQANHKVMPSHTDGPGKSHWGNLYGKSHSGSHLGISDVFLGIRCHHQ